MGVILYIIKDQPIEKATLKGNFNFPKKGVIFIPIYFRKAGLFGVYNLVFNTIPPYLCETNEICNCQTTITHLLGYMALFFEFPVCTFLSPNASIGN